MTSIQRNSVSNSTSVNKNKIFRFDRHADNLPKKLHTFYEEQKMVDIALVANDKVKIHAHRIVLSAASDYFQAMFCSTLKEAAAHEVDLMEVDSVTLKSIINYMYTASIELSIETVESVLRAADFFQINTIFEACCSFMEENIDVTNCLGIALLAEQLQADQLYKKSFTFAIRHFEKVYKEQEFLQLTSEQVCKLIVSDDLRSVSETVFFSVVAWTEACKKKRKNQMFQLLLRVRFKLLNPTFILNNRRSVSKTIECYDLILNWLDWHFANSDVLKKNPPINGEQSKSKNICIVSGLGLDTENFKLNIYHSESSTWSFIELPRPLKRRICYKTIVINNKLIVVGGRYLINGPDTSIVECLDLQTKIWKKLPAMKTPRSLPALANLNGDLYVVGGSINGILINVVEKYNFSRGKWDNVARMKSKFRNVQVAVLDGLLYATGPEDKSIVCYDPVSNQWTNINPNSQLSYRYCIAGINGLLYAVGGDHQSDFCKIVEFYHPSKEIWERTSWLELSSDCVRCTSLNNDLIVVTTNEVLKFNTINKKWTLIGRFEKTNSDLVYSSIFPM